MTICPIWGTPAEIVVAGSDGQLVDSSRTGGRYRISRTAMTTVSNLSSDEKACLTTWIIDQRRSGERDPFVTDDIVQMAKTSRQLRMVQRLDRFFMWAAASDLRPSDKFTALRADNEALARRKQEIMAWTETAEPSDAEAILNMLADEGFVTSPGVKTLTMRGWERADSWHSRGAQTRQAFVAMWFDRVMTPAFDDGFAPAIRDAGYDAFRIDRHEHGNKIDDEIIAGIRRSRFVVADFTCGLSEVDGRMQPLARGGVYYEAGFAQGLNIPVIWTCRADCIDHVHFDTRQFNHIVWSSPAELRQRLLTRIQAVIA